MRARLLLPALIIMTLLSTVSTAGASPVSFSDAQVHWAAQEIQLVYAQGIMQGVGNDLFAPDQPLTRAQLAACLVKEFNLAPAGTTGSTSKAAYDDVPKTAWYADAVATCAANNIFRINGRSFNPLGPVTRLETAIAVANCFAARQIPAPTISAFPNYADTGSVAAADQPSLGLVTYLGIMKGYGDYFRPGDRLTRAETACVLCRVNEVLRLEHK